MPSVIVLTTTGTVPPPLAMGRISHVRGIDAAYIDRPEMNLKILPGHPEYPFLGLFKKKLLISVPDLSLNNRNEVGELLGNVTVTNLTRKQN